MDNIRDQFDEDWGALVGRATAEWSALDERLVEALDALSVREHRRAYEVAVWIVERDNEHIPALTVATLALLGMKQAKRARTTSERVMSLAPANWRSHILGSWILISQNKRREAMTVAVASLELAPEDPLAFAAAADVIVQVSGRAEIAREVANRSIALDPGAIGPRLTIARVEELRSDWPAAITAYEDVLRVAPNHERSLLGLAQAQKRAGRHSDSSDTYQHLATTAPDSIMLRDDLVEETPGTIVDSARGCLVLVVAVLITVVVAAAAKPTLALAVLTITAAALTAAAPIRQKIALRLKPRAMAQASTKTTWATSNPDIIAGITITGAFGFLLFVSLYASSRA